MDVEVDVESGRSVKGVGGAIPRQPLPICFHTSGASRSHSQRMPKGLALSPKDEFNSPIDKIYLPLYVCHMTYVDWIPQAADQMAELYKKRFGGKDSGRYRISVKTLRQSAKQRRLYEDDIRALSREMLERGFVLIDMDTFFVVMSANSFVNYRRANEQSLGQIH